MSDRESSAFGREAGLRAERLVAGAEHFVPGEFLKRVGAKRQK